MKFFSLVEFAAQCGYAAEIRKTGSDIGTSWGLLFLKFQSSARILMSLIQIVAPIEGHRAEAKEGGGHAGAARRKPFLDLQCATEALLRLVYMKALFGGEPQFVQACRHPQSGRINFFPDTKCAVIAFFRLCQITSPQGNVGHIGQTLGKGNALGSKFLTNSK